MGTIILGVVLAVSLMMNVRYSVERKYSIAIINAQDASIKELTNKLNAKGVNNYETR
ncbi:hypothetical protein [Enterococcus phage Phi_Eg_SY1]|nr:hypothetical protein [Enterococcus phage Phi_Eg_SY1]